MYTYMSKRYFQNNPYSKNFGLAESKQGIFEINLN